MLAHCTAMSVPTRAAIWAELPKCRSPQDIRDFNPTYQAWLNAAMQEGNIDIVCLLYKLPFMLSRFLATEELWCLHAQLASWMYWASSEGHPKCKTGHGAEHLRALIRRMIDRLVPLHHVSDFAMTVRVYLYDNDEICAGHDASLQYLMQQVMMRLDQDEENMLHNMPVSELCMHLPKEHDREHGWLVYYLAPLLVHQPKAYGHDMREYLKIYRQTVSHLKAYVRQTQQASRPPNVWCPPTMLQTPAEFETFLREMTEEDQLVRIIVSPGEEYQDQMQDVEVVEDIAPTTVPVQTWIGWVKSFVF